MKKAMPFVQGLKKRLKDGEKASEVFERKLSFDEAEVLKEMRAGLVKMTGCKAIDLIIVDEGGKTGTTVEGEKRVGLPQVAESAVPGNPSFFFENV
jgi:leucyl-tRNA synthetase